MKKRRVLLTKPQTVANERIECYIDAVLIFKISLTLEIGGFWVYHDFKRIFANTEDF